MWFNSFTFLWFFPAVLILYYAIRSWSARKIFLLIASYFFYACWNPPFVLLLIASSAWDYTVGRLLGVVTDRWTRTAVYSVVHSATLQRRRNLGQWLQLRRDGGEVLAFLNNEDATAKPDTRQTHGFYPMRKVISEEDLLHGGQRASVMTEYAQQRADVTAFRRARAPVPRARVRCHPPSHADNAGNASRRRDWNIVPQRYRRVRARMRRALRRWGCARGRCVPE